MYSGGSAAGSSAAIAAAVIAQAIKASGAIVRVRPADFMIILEKVDDPLVVVSESRFFKTTFQYLTSYKGLTFFTKSGDPLPLKDDIELIIAQKIWIPA